MKTVIDPEIAAKTIWDILKGKSKEVSNEAYVFGLKWLYFRHKGYDVTEINLPVEGLDDKIVELLNMYIIMNDDIEYGIRRFIESIPLDFYQEIYPKLLVELFKLKASVVSYSASTTSSEIDKLLSHIAIINDCKTIFDPFCGSAGILNFLPAGFSYSGQELSRVSFIEAALTSEIYNNRISISLSNDNSIWNWDNNIYDGVISIPPFAAFLRENEREAVEQETNVHCNFLEDLPMVRGFLINHARVTIVLLPYNFCYGNGHLDVRRFLVGNNYVDTIISLSKNILYGIGLKPILLICKTDRQNDDPVRFIFADDYIIGNSTHNTRLDSDRLIADLDSSFNIENSLIPRDVIKQNNYILTPEVYYPVIQPENSTNECLYNLIKHTQGERKTLIEGIRIIDGSILSSNSVDVFLNTSRTSEREISTKNLKYYENKDGHKFLIDLNLGGKRSFALHTSSEPFMCSSSFKVYIINEGIVDPEYLVHVLLINHALKRSVAPLSVMLDIKLPIVPMRQQMEIVKRLKDEYIEQTEHEAKADRERLGKKTVQSEIEHILGVTQHKIGRLLDCMLSNKPSDDQYFNYVKKLKDNFDYMGRVIHFTNMPIESFNLTKGDFSAFMEEYVNSWQNYGSGVFSIKLQNNLEEKTEVNFDRMMMTVMLDAILDNASRHGFQKRKSDANELIISLDLVTESESAYIVISIANNGRPMADGFTIDDYISRGRYSATSGRSGLGGFHAYQVAKGHGGFISLSSNNQWSVIIDVLIPTLNVNIENLPTYGKEYR